MKKRLTLALLGLACALTFSGCLAAAAAGGAAVGYGAYKEGYRVQSPVKKTD